ncbi:hypothetical protein M422DRAFT_46245 [Sphaerobolus stellatus SS14]|uniref:BED-type domain-containing protein n=1 Tax=Sphaerobolus stellatus (strain SS14) TaxID=990650 RepID=A0A0C9VU56_SPHS4|nr:hypothetical protein M422DRAFT_46245 [Sphaerobolus stellatus SS14]
MAGSIADDNIEMITDPPTQAIETACKKSQNNNKLKEKSKGSSPIQRNQPRAASAPPSPEKGSLFSQQSNANDSESDPDDPKLNIPPPGEKSKGKKNEDRAAVKLFYTKPASPGDVRYCKVCQKLQETNLDHFVATYAPTMGNSGLKRHLKNQHPHAFKQCLNIEAGLGQTVSLSSQPTLDGHLVKIPPKIPFLPERLSGALVKLISACDLPFSLIEKPEFVDVIHVLKSDIRDEDIPGQKAMVLALMKEFELEKGLLKDRLKAMPSDELSGSHSGNNLVKYVVECLIELGIEKKIIQIGWITTDNATNNGTMVKHIEELLFKKGIEWDSSTRHIRCC